jgi:hypothetical protein
MGVSIMNHTPVWAFWGWEPINFYRLTGKSSIGTNNVSGDELEKWYLRLHDPATVEAAARLGVDCIVTHFLKGMGWKHEAQEIQRTRELVECCHKRRVRVLGYCQFGSLFQGSFFKENPDAETWLARKKDGSPQTWLNCKYRFMPCINSREFVEYMKRCIYKGIIEIGLDGLHFDNSYSRPCFCPRCQALYGDSIRTEAEITNEPVDGNVQEWINDRQKRLCAVVRELTEYARSLKNDISLIWNPNPFAGIENRKALRSSGFPEFGAETKLLWAEGGNFPGVHNGKLVHQAGQFKCAEAAGYRCFGTVWKHNKEGAGLPEAPDEVALVTAEAVVFGSVPGSNWLLRPGYLEKMLQEDPLSSEFGKYVSFIRENEELIEGSKPFGNTALYLDWDRCGSDFRNIYGAFLMLQQILLQKHIPFDIVLDQKKLCSYSVAVVTPGCEIGTVAYDGKIIHPRLEPDFLERIISGYGSAIALDASADRLANQLEDIPDVHSISLDAPDSVVIERRKTLSGRTVFHLLNYNNSSDVSGIKLALKNIDGQIKIHSPGVATKNILPENNVYHLPEFRTWTILETTEVCHA